MEQLSGRVRVALDSGAHSLYEQVMKTRKSKRARKGVVSYDYTETKDFWEYVDRYAEYVCRNEELLDFYVTVDVIFQPRTSYRVQRYLENNFGLSPIPVFHYTTNWEEDKRWLKRYMDQYEYIGIGGIGQDVPKDRYYAHGDRVFEMLTDDHKAHGFAMTSPDMLHRWPWFSVDSTSWVLYGRYGVICVPLDGKYDKPPWVVTVSRRSPARRKISGNHISSLTDLERERVLEYIQSKGYELGESEVFEVSDDYKLEEGEQWAGKDEEDIDCFPLAGIDPCVKKVKRVERVITPGVSNDHLLRDELNLIYYLDMEEAAGCIVYIGGNFPAMKKPEVENRFKELMLAYRTWYNRMISYFFYPDIETVMEIRRQNANSKTTFHE
jgi:hypothetical protein